MRKTRPALFKGRHFEAEIIVLCVRWYLRYVLSYRDLEELMAERNLHVDHVTIWRWVQHYAPELAKRCRRELRRTNASWRVDETYLRVAGKWTYLYRAVDSEGNTIDFLVSSSRDAAQPDVSSGRPYGPPAILAHESSMSTETRRIRKSSFTSSAAAICS